MTNSGSKQQAGFRTADEKKNRNKSRPPGREVFSVSIVLSFFQSNSVIETVEQESSVAGREVQKGTGWKPKTPDNR
jgi:hypothetical protein